MCQKLLIIIGDNYFWVMDTYFRHFRPKNILQDSFLDPTNYKNSKETFFKIILRLRKSMGGIAIDIWEKSDFFGSIGSQKGAKNKIFL